MNLSGSLVPNLPNYAGPPLKPVDVKQPSAPRLPMMVTTPRKGFDNLAGIWYPLGFNGSALIGCTFFVVWTRRAGTWDTAAAVVSVDNPGPGQSGHVRAFGNAGSTYQFFSRQTEPPATITLPAFPVVGELNVGACQIYSVSSGTYTFDLISNGVKYSTSGHVPVHVHGRMPTPPRPSW